jgi:hypothetical protein
MFCFNNFFEKYFSFVTHQYRSTTCLLPETAIINRKGSCCSNKLYKVEINNQTALIQLPDCIAIFTCYINSDYISRECECCK